LEKAGVEINERGFIKIDEKRRTTAEKIYAIGDVAGEPMLAHKASYEGKIAVEVIAGEPAVYDARAVPAVVFTDPELAWCGLTETEAKKQKREVKRIRFAWQGSGRALTLGRTEGLTKLIVDPQTEADSRRRHRRVSAGEMIAEGMLAIEMGATAKDLALTMHAHPTLSETIGEAAECSTATARTWRRRRNSRLADMKCQAASARPSLLWRQFRSLRQRLHDAGT